MPIEHNALIKYKFLNTNNNTNNNTIRILIDIIDEETGTRVQCPKCLILKSKSVPTAYTLNKNNFICDFYDVKTKTHINVYYRELDDNQDEDDISLLKEYVVVKIDPNGICKYFLYYQE